MSLGKSLAAFLISSLFIMFLYLSITSYTIGNLIQKESIKAFVTNQLKEEVASKTCGDLCDVEVNSQKCDEYCSYLQDSNERQECKNNCLSDASNMQAKQTCMNACLSKSNESQKYIFNTVDEVYSKKIISNLSVDDIIPVFRNFVILFSLSLIFGVSLFFVSDKPVSKTGNNIVVVAISMLSVAVIPAFIVTPEITVVKMVSDYIMEGLYKQIVLGIVLLVIGIIIILIGKKKNK